MLKSKKKVAIQFSQKWARIRDRFSFFLVVTLWDELDILQVFFQLMKILSHIFLNN